MPRLRLLISALLIAAVTLLASPALACPSCSENLPNQSGKPGASADAAKPQLAEGIYYSILFMLGMITLVPLSLGGLLYYHQRKRARPAPLFPEAAKH